MTSETLVSPKFSNMFTISQSGGRGQIKPTTLALYHLRKTSGYAAEKVFHFKTLL